jgi:RecA/RadA recombinase
MTPPDLPSLLSAPRLLDTTLPARETILDPILTTKSLALLYGPRGIGKTFVALGIARAAAAGGSFLGWRATRPHRVLYVDGEMAAVDMRQRLAQLGPPPPTLDFMLADLQPVVAPDLATVEDQYRLMEAWGRPELVVLDNLSSLVGFKSGNAEAWSTFQRFLVLQRCLGRAVLLVHHANKKGFQRGTNRREDVLDIVLSLRRPDGYAAREGARMEIHFEKARGLAGDAVEPIEARLVTDDTQGACWTWQPARDDALDRLVTLLKEGLNPNQAARTLGISKSKSYLLRRRAVKRGLLN